MINQSRLFTGHRLLVANRSEIACRIFQGAKELGLSTVAIYSESQDANGNLISDFDARHVTFADRAVSVRGYLDVESIIEAAKKTGATMIHPGYGFLSERPHFARAVEAAGILFLGPLAETMEAMGGKIAAKEIAEKIGVPTVPWAKFDYQKSTPDQLKQIADSIGFPILIKAHAGGGGKGMRRVNQHSELIPAAESASREAMNAFGDGTLFLERFIERPRHIEVQIFGDGTGRGVHLYERECSLQRRHQKVWEEAPAPHLSAKAREGLFESALKLVAETHYRSAGTIEFLVDDQENFYFIEMNTRLQVEHPVTEAITGIDLVHEQIRLAAMGSNYSLPTVLDPRGHAIEVRVYAEDPAQEFMPCVGQVTDLIWPAGPGIRVDRGIEVGQEMSPHFDSMCAKLIVHAASREVAVRKMQFALAETVIAGIGCNLEYLNYIAHQPSVIEGRVTTKFLDQEIAPFSPMPTGHELSILTVIDQVAQVGSGSGKDTGSTNQDRAWANDLWSRMGSA